MLTSLLWDTISVWRAGQVEAATGETVESWATPTLVGSGAGWIQPKESEEDRDRRDKHTVKGILYAEAALQVSASDRVSGTESPDSLWIVVGDPRQIRSPFSPSHIEADVERSVG